MPKSVLLLVIDALATRTILPAIEEGRLPWMAQLIERGQLCERCTSIFPSITPAATASLVTGKWPREHGIAGAFWYDSERNKTAYYGSDFWVVLSKSVGQYFHEFLVTLNFERLKSQTLYETVELGGGNAACVNYMWFRSDTPHEVNVPLLWKLFPGVNLQSSIRGPAVLMMADFVAKQLNGKPFQARGGPTRRFGFHDETTSDYLLHLAAHGLPDFTLAYFPNNDFDSHERGSKAAVETVESVDSTIGELFSQSGGIDRFLERTAVVVVGDHAQSDLNSGSQGERSIRLDQVLRDFSLAPDACDWQGGEELMICPNMRAAQFYFHEATDRSHRQLVDRLLAEPHVDQVFWRQPEEKRLSAAQSRYHIRTADRGDLEFWQGDDGPRSAIDSYGNCWSWRGDLSVVDASSAAGHIEFGVYPNALDRIAQGFAEQSGDVWATARLGFEFQAGNSSVHSAGSHGSLHELDSMTPLIVAGGPPEVALPRQCRLTDVAPICVSLMK